MSLRDTMPKARISSSHYFLTFSRGESMRCFAISPFMLAFGVVIAPVLLSVYLGATLYLVYRDDMLAGLMSRQTEMQYAYEDRLASMRAQVDRVTGRQLLDQNTLEGRVHELLSKQAQIESRATVIASLAQQAGIATDTTSTIAKPGDARSAITRATAALPGAAAIPGSASAFAPIQSQGFPAMKAIGGEKPRPEALEQRSEIDRVSATALDVAANPDVPVETRLRSLSGSLQRIEVAQIHAVDAVGSAARRSSTRLRTALRDAGLPIDRMLASGGAKGGVGGPFVPLKADPNGSLFEREVFRMQNDFMDSTRLTSLVRKAPLRKPLSGGLEVTSPYGARVDPFFGRMATHTGVDLRDASGAPARATAGGKVVSAGWAGGYGNMVEIDHGNGLTTRYGHLSAILVNEGQTVEARDVIGKVGSTGRSTGPHLHYEVRVDGEPVDPMRFLRAGEKLAAAD
jgi:murein DD-endopeptidase MepM/ murein hydrolase activator NlpD